MAASVSWNTLRELAAFRADHGCAVSVYLGLDPSTTPTPDEVDSKVRSLLHEVERAGAGRDLGHEAREALKGDVQRIRRFFDDDFDRAGAQGIAVFAHGPANFFTTLPLTEPVEDEAKVGSELYLAPLVPLVGKWDGALVVVVNRERGELFRLRNGRLLEVADRSEEQPYRRHDQGGWSQARYQRHVDELAAGHVRTVADEVDRRVRRRPGPVVVVGPEELRTEFYEALPQDTRGAIVGWTVAEAHAGPAEVLGAVQPVLEEWRARRERESLERWRHEAGRSGRAVGGWERTLEAASDGRIDLLLFQEGAEREAYQCPACGRASTTDGSCPLDGTTMEARAEGLDLAVHQTLAHGGTVQAVRHHEDLGPVEGIGALLRY